MGFLFREVHAALPLRELVDCLLQYEPKNEISAKNYYVKKRF